MNSVAAPRSALYMPASAARLLAKGPTLDVDAVIIDLEDSVAPDAKVEARAAAVQALSSLDYGERLRVLRVNAGDTEWYADDVQAAVAARPDAVLLPKADNGEQVAHFVQRLDAAGLAADVSVWAMLESPAAVVAAPSIAEAGLQLDRFTTVCVGNNDLSLAAGMAVPAPRELLQAWLLGFVAAARAGGLAILDGVYNDFKDEAGYQADCRASSALGMDGRTLIHPQQIDGAHRAFSPDADAIEEARLIVEAFADPANAGRGALSINGRMFERLHLTLAEKTLQRARRLNNA